jgi:hypothetical protein
MPDYNFIDITDEVRSELMYLPGSIRRPEPNKSFQRAYLMNSLVIDYIVSNNHPLISQLLDKKIKEEEFYAQGYNLDWMPTWGCQMFRYYDFITSRKAGAGIEDFSIKSDLIIPQTKDIVLMGEGKNKPIVYGISIPTSLLDPLNPTNALQFNVHFRPNPAYSTNTYYEIPSIAQIPVNSRFKNFYNHRNYYPFGWDYLYFKLWYNLYHTTGKINRDYTLGLAYQAYKSKKEVVTVMPLLDTKSFKEESIVNIEGLHGMLEGIKKFIVKAFLANRDNSSEINIRRVSLSCNSNGVDYVLNLLPHLYQLDYIRELYLFDPTDLDNLHNWFVQHSLKWAGNNPDRFIRIYTQPYTAFNTRFDVINDRKVLSKRKINSILSNPNFPGRSLSEINVTLYEKYLQNSDFFPRETDRFDVKNFSVYDKWSLCHSMIPSIMYKDALERSGFTNANYNNRYE